MPLDKIYITNRIDYRNRSGKGMELRLRYKQLTRRYTEFVCAQGRPDKRERKKLGCGPCVISLSNEDKKYSIPTDFESHIK